MAKINNKTFSLFLGDHEIALNLEKIWIKIDYISSKVFDVFLFVKESALSLLYF